MGKARILILLVAALAGGAAFFLVSTGQTPQEAVDKAVPTQKEVTVRVLVASKDFAQGAVMRPQDTKWIDWPKKSVPEFYVTESEQEFVEALPQMRALRAIKANEPIYADNTVRHGESGMLAAIMTPGMRAVTAKVSAEQASGGFVLPGDRVDLYVSSGNTDAGGASLLLANIRVLAIDQMTTVDEEESVVGRTVTFEVTPRQVEIFLQARETKNITVVLRSIFDGTFSPSVDLPRPDEVIVLRYGQG